MKILIVGNGWLGNILKNYLSASHEVEMFPRRIRQLHFVTGYDVVINAAAKTQIDWCEKNKMATLETNALDATYLAGLCAQEKCQYVFISSACIFESVGENDWKSEFSAPSPACFYAKSKAIAEELIQEVYPSTLIVRPRLPISEVPHPRNTLDKLKKYTQLQTNQESVTVVEDMLPVLQSLIENQCTGVYHLINAGTISPVEIGDEMGLVFSPIKKHDMDAGMARDGKARRVTSLISSFRVPALPHIQIRIKEVIKKHQSLCES